MNQYRYIKLRNGEDIVSMITVQQENGTVEMTLPCNIGLSPSVTGKGSVIKLSPLVPFTKDNKIVIAASEIVYTTTIGDEFIAFYDKAIKDWVHLRDEVGLDVMSPKQELDKGADALARMTEIMKDRLLPEDELSFEEELDLMDYEDKKVLH
tara:strand:+ start:394 stop:849 length:456 start_codon:yes stop_codon:yes gene_type:complete